MLPTDDFPSIAADKIRKARFDIMRDHPFYATIIMSLEMVVDPAVKTTATNGRSIRISPEWATEARHDLVRTKIAKQAMHIALEHPLRLGDRDKGRANKAMDYAVNPMLKDAGFRLPEDALVDSRYDNMAWEQIYRLLLADETGSPETGGQQGQGQGSGAPAQPGQGDQQSGQGQDDSGAHEVEPFVGEDGESAPTADEVEEAKESNQVLLAQAAQAARRAGSLGADLERAIDDVLAPKVDWRDVLQRFIRARAKDDYSWSRPNRRFAWQGMILPSLQSQKLGTVVLVLDTSGSIRREQLTAFQAEVHSIFEQIRPSEVVVLYADICVKSSAHFGPFDEIQLQAKGGGGTKFQPTFDWINRELDQQPEALVYFTDLDSTDSPVEPDYPVLWITPFEGHPRKPEPFGERIGMPPGEGAA